MRKLTLLSFVALILMNACGDEQKNPILQASPKDSLPSSAGDIPNNKFENMPPYTAAEIGALLPGQLEGANKSEAESGEILGTHYAKALYTINDSVAVELSLFDCAGSGGAGFYQFQFVNMLTASPESEDIEKKTIDFNGQKAIQQFDNNSYRSTFTYPSGRVLITLESEALDAEGLKAIAKKLSIQ